MLKLGILVGCVLTVVLAWGVGELHYRNCLKAVEVAYSGPSDILELLPGGGRGDAVQDCSRLPF